MYSDQERPPTSSSVVVPLFVVLCVLTCTFLVIWTTARSTEDAAELQRLKYAQVELNRLQNTVAELQSELKQLKQPELMISSVLTASLANHSDFSDLHGYPGRLRRQSNGGDTSTGEGAFSVLLKHILNSMKRYCQPREKFCFTGPKGNVGHPGLPGPGLPGPAGEKGTVGEKGMEGTTGKLGPPGVGIRGDKGDRGRDGRNGTRGPKGLKGEKGENRRNPCLPGILPSRYFKSI